MRNRTMADLEAAAIAELVKANSDLVTPRLFTHYLYFERRDTAEKVSRDLQPLGFETTVRESSYDNRFLLLARHSMPPRLQPILEARQLLEDLVTQAGGEYDGWEASAK